MMGGPSWLGGARGPTGDGSANRELPADGDKGTQRQRLLAGIVHVNSQLGYEDATIALVIDHAGVSRRTFYEYFAGKEACFLAALEEIEHRVLVAATRSVEQQPPPNAAAAVITALVTFAHKHPAHARLLMNETMAAGPRALDARDRGVERLGRLIEQAYRHVHADTLVPALPSEIIVGTTYRLLASSLRRDERDLPMLGRGLHEWLASHAWRTAERRWRILRPAPAPPRSPFLGPAPLRAPPAPKPGRPRRSAPPVSESQRLRIIFATVEIIGRDGYAGGVSVAAICRAAGIERRVFYELFTDKRNAVTAVHQFVFQNLMAVTAGAFFAAEEWPRRIWEAARAFTQFLEQNPALAHAALVEGHVGGAAGVKRLEELLLGFTIFLQEGYGYEPRRRASAPSSVALQTIAHANFEILYRQARSDGANMAGLVAPLAYVSLAPFVGVARASELIDEMLSG
jgi:AcrR family transcriptional regulator